MFFLQPYSLAKIKVKVKCDVGLYTSDWFGKVRQ